MTLEFKVLDKGFVKVIDHLGNDLTVVNSARISFGKRQTIYSEKDYNLVKYLKRNKHFSPFRHLIVQLHLKFPEFVARQLYKHVVGIETTSSYPTKDHAWNELSLRYVPVTQYYHPEYWRKQSDDNKQASDGKLSNNKQNISNEIFNQTMSSILQGYDKLLTMGVAKEQARMILPLNLYTEVWWTASWQALTNFVELRDHPHAQLEIREYAKAIKSILFKLYPKTSEVWFQKE